MAVNTMHSILQEILLLAANIVKTCGESKVNKEECAKYSQLVSALTEKIKAEDPTSPVLSSENLLLQLYEILDGGLAFINSSSTNNLAVRWSKATGQIAKLFNEHKRRLLESAIGLKLLQNNNNNNSNNNNSSSASDKPDWLITFGANCEADFVYVPGRFGREEPKHIGSGAFSDVYEGVFHSAGDEKIAVKVMRLTSKEPNIDALFKSFGKEVNLVSKLRHPNIVTLYGAFEQKNKDDWTALMIFEFLPGCLSDKLQPSEPLLSDAMVNPRETTFFLMRVCVFTIQQPPPHRR